MVSRLRSVSFALTSIVLSSLAVAILLEILLRCFPVNEGLRALSVNQDNPVLRYAPGRTSIYSKGWNFSVVNKGRTNNYGFISNIDYDPNSIAPLLAIIGDSYVEAAMVPYAQTTAAILAGSVGQNGRVYSFGSSGSSLSQYLAYAQYVRETFRPACLAILIIGNDFDESLLKYKSEPGYHYFEEMPNGELALKRIDREVNPWRRILASSALAMYLVVNLEASQAWERLKAFRQSYSVAGQSYAGNVPAHVNDTRLLNSQRAVDAFLSMLPSMAGIEPSRIILGMDGNRREIYGNRQEPVAGNYFGAMRRYLIRAAEAKGFEVIDMQQKFIAHFRQHGQRFEFPTDGHWNEVGHAVFAQAMQDSPAYKGCFAIH